MLKRILANWLRLIANWIYHQPRLKQLTLSLIEKLPGGFEGRLRSTIATSNRQLSASELRIVVDPLSRMEKKQLQDLRNLAASQGPAGEIRQTELKPRLAYFSPMPPARSGISHYSLMLIPQLARHYEIEVIVDQSDIDTTPHLNEYCAVRRYDWFCENAGRFDRILYHIGNSDFHGHMLEALEKWPGVVMLHDFFLGHLVRHLDTISPDYLAKALYLGWGYDSMSGLKQPGIIEELVWNCPLNAVIMDNALGIIAHSHYSADLTQRYFGNWVQQQWAFIPHLREPAVNLDKARARAELGIPEDAFLVCSFGHITPTKLHELILGAWHNSRLGAHADCWLVFVGEIAAGEHGRMIHALIKSSGNDRIKVTGWADSALFETYLTGADVAIQLRSKSRGETSGAVIDCMNHGIATIVNAHGTMADLADDAVYKLPDTVSRADLVDVLEQLFSNTEFRKQLGAAAQKNIVQNHSPIACGDRYHQAIEDFYVGYDPYYKSLTSALNSLEGSDPGNDKLATLFPDISATPPTGLRPRQLLVDVSAIAHNDLKTGIERVVRAQLLELLKHPPEGSRVEPIYLHYFKGHWQYQYARGYAHNLLELPGQPITEEKIDCFDDDILYIPDLNAHSVIRAHADGLFLSLKDQGVTIHSLIHDILPVTHPDYFPPHAAATHSQWLASITAFSDQIICISQAVADQYQQWRQKHIAPAECLPPVSVNHHGSDIQASHPTSGIPHKGKSILKQLGSAPTFLMVGTIEPRKGHLDALAAFDALWQSDEQANLVIVGKEGWKNLPAEERGTIPETIKKLDWHPRRNKQLFWLSDISDEYLEAVYSHSQCLLAASIDEGFGLPLIEAAQAGLAIIARDVPVFREVAGDNAWYFDNHSRPLAHVIREWLNAFRTGQIDQGAAFTPRTWEENVRDLKRLLNTPLQRQPSEREAEPESRVINGLY